MASVLYPIKLVKDGVAQKLKKTQIVQVFAVDYAADDTAKAKPRLIYKTDTAVSALMPVDDKSTKDIETETAALVAVDDKLVGKAVKFRAPTKGGVYTGESTALPELVKDATLTAKDCIKLKYAALTTANRDAFFYQLVAREYPHLADLNASKAIEAGSWAEASLLIAILGLAEHLKMREIYPDQAPVPGAKEAFVAALKEGGFGDATTKVKLPGGDAAKELWVHWLNPNLHIFAAPDGKPMSGRWPTLEKAFGSAPTRANFAKLMNSYAGWARKTVLAEAQRVYKDVFTTHRAFTGTDVDFSTLPQAAFAIVGDGSGTAGVLGPSGEGIGLMSYTSNDAHPQLSTLPQATVAAGWSATAAPTAAERKKYEANKAKRICDSDGNFVDLPEVSAARETFKGAAKGRRTALHIGAAGFDASAYFFDVVVRCGPLESDVPLWTLYFSATKSSNTSATILFQQAVKRIAGGKTETTKPKLLGNVQTAAGFAFDKVRRELSFPPGVFRHREEFTVDMASWYGEELFYALAVVPSAIQVNLQDIYAWSDFIPKAEEEMSAEMLSQIKDIKEVLSYYDTWKVKMTGGGVGKFRDPKRMEQVVGGGTEIAGYKWDTDKKEEADKLRCSYVDFEGSDDAIQLNIFSYTDPTNIGKDGPSKGFSSNKQLSLLRCWAILGLVCKQFAKDGKHKEAVTLFDAGGAASDVNRVSYLKRVADGAFDYDASKKAAG